MTFDFFDWLSLFGHFGVFDIIELFEVAEKYVPKGTVEIQGVTSCKRKGWETKTLESVLSKWKVYLGNKL